MHPAGQRTNSVGGNEDFERDVPGDQEDTRKLEESLVRPANVGIREAQASLRYSAC